MKGPQVQREKNERVWNTEKEERKMHRDAQVRL